MRCGKSLYLSKEGIWAGMARVRYRRCRKCGTEWAELRDAGYRIPYSPEDYVGFEIVCVLPGASRSGRHYAELRSGGLPMAPGSRRWQVVVGKFRLYPHAWAGDWEWRNRHGLGQVVAEAVADHPFWHVVCVVGRVDPPSDFDEVAECGVCYRRRAIESPSFRQDDLFITQDAEPRLRPGGDEVSGVYLSSESEAWFFDHVITGKETFVYVRKDLATAVVYGGGYISISRDGQGDPLIIWGPAHLNMYHSPVDRTGGCGSDPLCPLGEGDERGG